MFATLLGALPVPDGAGEDPDRTIELAVRAQEAASLEPITDGRLGPRWFDHLVRPDEVVAGWRATAALTERAVKQAIPGPMHRQLVAGATDAAVERIADAAAALAEAGCPLVEIEETSLDRLADESERRRFVDAHERLLARVQGTHVSLSIVGGAPPDTAWSAVLGLPYASLAVDLIAGSDSWNLVTRWPGDRGVIAGVEAGREPDEPKEVLLWAAHYAASTKGRGLDRVGIGSAGSWANLSWEAAVRKMGILGEAARLASMPPSAELAASLDPRAVSARAAALGTTVRPARRPSGR